ncbi:MAG: TIGR02147 family protein [Alphaproteobacteria bacterium]|nr:TIGR02147 family protein [Alphaproteobacteria bacterium]
MADAPDIFPYISYRAWLGAWIRHRSSRTGKQVAEEIGVTRSMISNVLSLRRHLGPEPFDLLVALVGLEPLEEEYLRALHPFERARRGSPAKEAARRRLEALRSLSRPKRLAPQHLQLLAEGHHAAIFELVRCPDFKPDPGWLVQRLRYRLTASEAQQALDRLVDRGLLRQRLDGRYEPIEPVVVDAPAPTPEQQQLRRARLLTLYEAHAEIAQAAWGVDAALRELSSVTVAVPTARLPWLKARIQQLHEEVLAWSEAAEDEPDEVYLLNVQLVPLTRPVGRR